MERIWLKQYPAGVPSDIDVTQYSSLVELLEESFAKFADRKAFICMDKSISYRDLDQMSLAMAAYLQAIQKLRDEVARRKSERAKKRRERDEVCLSTGHGAKGLEWRCVFGVGWRHHAPAGCGRLHRVSGLAPVRDHGSRRGDR